ncbi:pre-RNA processing PIH1/Nop17-domain-containing protein [Scheffersomyces amazonensis]|uniref:pre-RNA processing PIH1/Nop17-domain-containing protein n=1 Tax=Scheffersomyces amazonensis TaxID=1078765 RepID=UPI00315C6488
MAAITEVGKVITLDPKPGFVVKTKIIEAKDYALLSRKVFINICQDSQVPTPEIEFDPAVVFPLIIDNKWEIPLIVSNIKNDKDKKGVASIVVDCCINPICFRWCQVSEDLKTILIEWCIEAVEMAYSYVFDREYSKPKMLAKGELSKTEIQESEIKDSGLQKRLKDIQENEILGLLEETNDIDMEEELPELTNIKGELKNKPLIEELSDMSIDSLPPKLSKPEITTSKQDLNQPQKIDFTLVIRKTEPTQIIQISSPQFNGSDLSLQLSPETQEIILKNLDSSLYFTRANNIYNDTISIPFVKSKPLDNINSFFVQSEQSLYIFI